MQTHINNSISMDKMPESYIKHRITIDNKDIRPNQLLAKLHHSILPRCGSVIVDCIGLKYFPANSEDGIYNAKLLSSKWSDSFYNGRWTNDFKKAGLWTRFFFDTKKQLIRVIVEPKRIVTTLSSSIIEEPDIEKPTCDLVTNEPVNNVLNNVFVESESDFNDAQNDTFIESDGDHDDVFNNTFVESDDEFDDNVNEFIDESLDNPVHDSMLTHQANDMFNQQYLPLINGWVMTPYGWMLTYQPWYPYCYGFCYPQMMN